MQKLFTTNSNWMRSHAVLLLFVIGVSPLLSVLPIELQTAEAAVSLPFLTSQNWIVPYGVTSITVKAWGGGGGGGGADSATAGGIGGGGAYATKVISVTPGETLTVTVGGGGTAGVSSAANGAGGAGGSGQGTGGVGGNSGTAGTSGAGGGGGGGSGVLRSGTVLVVAGGGGGGGGAGGLAGGAGGAGGVNGTAASGGGVAGTAGASATVNGTVGASRGGVDGGGAGAGGGGLLGGTGGGVGGSDRGGGGGGGGTSQGDTTTNGSGVTPGNSTDTDRANLGDGGAAATTGDAGIVVIRFVTTKVTYLTSGTTWTVPSDWSSTVNNIEVIGGGGGGGSNTGNRGKGGGGGGAYSATPNVSLTPGASVAYKVGTGGGADAAGTDTYFCNSTSNCATISGTAVKVGAKGGSGASNVTGGAGGVSSSGIGTTKYSGGTGGTNTAGWAGGGGGGAGGQYGNGANGGAASSAGGGGGGGADGGAIGGAGSTNNGGAGGNNISSAGGGAGGTSGSQTGGTGSSGGGGGGGYGSTTHGAGGAGGVGTEWDSTHGSGGGGGGAGDASQAAAAVNGGSGGLYGGGGGGAAEDPSDVGGSGAQGIIVIDYYVPDTVAPDPDPMTIASVAGASASSVTVTATTAVDPEGSPVQYYFGYVACGTANDGTGGADSGWQSSATYTNSGLQTNRCYGYKVAARDLVGNTTATSTSASTVYTFAAVPGTPALSNQTAYTAQITNAENGNPSSNPTTLFALQVSATSPTDSVWQGKYVNASGYPSASAVWLSDSSWDSLLLRNLVGGVQYTLQSKARNQSSIETAFSSGAIVTTLEEIRKVVRLLGHIRLQNTRLR